MGDLGTGRSLTPAELAADLRRSEARVAELEAELRDVRQAEADARRQAGIFRSIVDGLADGVVYADLNGKVKFFNAGTRRLLPRFVELHQDKPLASLTGVFREDGVTALPVDEMPIVRAIRGESVEAAEVYLRADDADPGVWLQVSAHPIHDEQGAPCGGVSVVRDLTAARRTRHDLQRIQERFEAVLDNTPACVYMKDPLGQYLLINRAFEDLFHVSRADMLGRTDYELFPREMADDFRRNDLRVLQAGAAIQFEEVAPHDDGPHNYVSVKFPLLDAKGAAYAVCGISTDITPRIRAEVALQAEQRFLTQLLRAHERDRQLLVYELHDGLAQLLAGAVLQLESITVSRPAEGARERRSFDAALDLLRKSVGEVRRLMSGLHPLVLDESGLVQAIEYLIAEPDAAGGLAIEFEADVQFDRLSALVEGTLFRIVQESLNNIRRHSRARRAKVTLRQRADRLTLIVRDWGVGFDVAQAGVGRHGLDGIRKRAEVLGGTAIILSDPGEGTSIEIDVPLALAAE